jgi:membrane dipeptidase
MPSTLSQPLLVDAHEDLAWNMLTFGRDYTLSVQETRRLEQGGLAQQVNGDSLLGWPEYQQGRVALVFATIFAAPLRRREGEWDTQVYAGQAEARQLYHAQLDAYHRLVDEHPDKFRLVRDRSSLADLLAGWEMPGAGSGNEEPGQPVGLAVLMEGAEAVGRPEELEEWWAGGVRLIGPAWAGNRFCGGTGEPGPLTREGYALLEAMAEFGFVLDISHMDEKAALQALDAYPRPVIASHSNAIALLKDANSNRFLTEQVLRRLLERDGVVGLVPFNKFLAWGWTEQDGRQAVSLLHLADQIDHICQLAGDARHAGLGSDFDGGFGLQSAPAGIDTIADLQKLSSFLAEKGYTEEDLTAILGGNWLSLLEQGLPDST